MLESSCEGGERTLKSPREHIQERGEVARGRVDWMAFFTANLLHEVQASREVVDLKNPFRQDTQAPFSSVVPGPHVQVGSLVRGFTVERKLSLQRQEVDPGSEVMKSGQVVQISDPSELLYLPASQFVHAVEAMPEILPEGQRWQAV